MRYQVEQQVKSLRSTQGGAIAAPPGISITMVATSIPSYVINSKHFRSSDRSVKGQQQRRVQKVLAKQAQKSKRQAAYKD